MRASKPSADVDVDAIIDINCDPELSPERHAEARQLLQGALGPYAVATLRACGRAMIARREAADLRQQMESMLAGAQLRGIVTGVHNGRVRLLLGGAERVLVRPEGLSLGIGQTVLTDGEGRTVLGAGDFIVGGQTYTFCEPLEDRHALVQPMRDSAHDEIRQLALIADSVDPASLRPGDRVLGWSIQSGNVVLVTRRLGASARPVADDTGVSRKVVREDIVGLDDVLRETDLLFLDSDSPAYAALLERANRALTGFVFQGVPGCGKSMVAEYLTGRVRQRGGRALVRTASHFLSKWVGEGSARLRADVSLLDASYVESGVRPLLIIDELEAIALDRSQPRALGEGHLDVLDTLLSLLTRTEARVIGISNVADRFLETALLRDGRLRIIPFPPTLNPEQVTALVIKCLAGLSLRGEADGPSHEDPAQTFGAAVSDLVFAPSGRLASLLRVQLADGRVLRFGARDLATAAAVADGIVRPTLARAVRRDLEAGLAEPSPLSLDELREAAARYFDDRCRSITRDNVRSVLPGRIPEDQAVIKVERSL